MVPSTSSSSQRLPLCQSEMTGSSVTRKTPVETPTAYERLGQSSVEEEEEP